MTTDEQQPPADTIDALLAENRTFPPSEEFKAEALVDGHRHVRRGGRRRPGLLGPPGRRAARLVEDWHTICEWELPYAKWFVGGKLNVAHNCLDRHVAAGRGDKVAIYWEGEPGDTRTVTYAELLDEVQRFANVLKSLGVVQGRPGQHLPADDPRGGGGDARLCPHRRRPQRRVRRVLRPRRWPTGSTTPRPRC